MAEIIGREVLLKDENGEVIIPYVNVDITSQLDALLNNIYPVGSVYLSITETCPLATLISGSTWELVSSGKALWTGNGTNANTTIVAGLPNITGQFYFNEGTKGATASGSFYTNGTAGSYAEGHTSGGKNTIIAIDASKSNSIYGKSSTVQPPAYVVNVWKRTA